MLAADSAQTGSGTGRMMLMLTRSCELRCSYCFVALTETGPEMPVETALRAVDVLMTADRPRLGLQLFGGEPTRWRGIERVIEYAAGHPGLGGRPVEIQLTTNGLGDYSRVRESPVVVQVSLDGTGEDNRFRRPHLLDTEERQRRWDTLPATLDGLSWFMNVTLPPAAAGEALSRYHHARELGVPAVQINYATGMRWAPTQIDAYLDGLVDTLRADATERRLYNWHNAADPAPLCGDTIVDVDGTVLQVGGIFHEKRFPALREAYRLGHVGEGTFARWTLAELWQRTHAALSPDEADVFFQGMRLGAAQDLVCRLVAHQASRV